MDFIQPIYTYVRSGKIFDQDPDAIKETLVGNGFFAEGNYFITALHVIKEAQAMSVKFGPYIKYNDRKIELKLEEAIFYMSMPDERTQADYQYCDNGDLVVFKIEGARSEMILSDKSPIEGQTLKSAYYTKNSSNELELNETVGIVNGLAERTKNFFAATMIPTHPTQGGSSGSPIYCGDTIYGILHAGYKEMPDICVFSSSKPVVEALKINSIINSTKDKHSNI